MNSGLLERVRTTWENLNDRERRMLLVLGGVAGALLLLLPPVMVALHNTQLRADNAELRAALGELATEHARLSQLVQERRAAEDRYKHKAPPLGSFLEAEAKKQGLTLQEVTDQPERTLGRYQRRSVTVSLPQAALTPVVNLLSSIVQSPYPVAVDKIQIDHYQPGDQFNVKLGVQSFEKQAGGLRDKGGATGSGTKPTQGG